MRSLALQGGSQGIGRRPHRRLRCCIAGRHADPGSRRQDIQQRAPAVGGEHGCEGIREGKCSEEIRLEDPAEFVRRPCYGVSRRRDARVVDQQVDVGRGLSCADDVLGIRDVERDDLDFRIGPLPGASRRGIHFPGAALKRLLHELLSQPTVGTRDEHRPTLE